MRSRTLRAAAALLFVSVLIGPGAGRAGQSALDSIKLPPVRTEALGNGMRIFFIRDELPQITIVVSLGFGKLYENRENAGMGELMARTISLGGSKKYPGTALHEYIDTMGGRLSIESSWERTHITIRVLERFRKEAFDIMADLMKNPNFDPAYFATARALVADHIRRKQDDPAEIAFGKVREIIFNGQGYGSNPTQDTVGAITLERLRDTWRRHCVGNNIMVGVYSSVDGDEIAALSRDNFSVIDPGMREDYKSDPRATAERVAASRGKIYFYQKDIPQATIILGTLAPDIAYRGNYSLEIMNYVLGGGSFNSRLMNEIRVKRGLAYAVQSILKSRYRTGVFLAFAQVENRTAGEVLSLLKENMEKLEREPMTADEIEWAKKSISSSFIFQFDTPMNVLSNYMEIAINGLPADYFSAYLDHIQGVSKEDIQGEARNLFKDGTVILVVGGSSVVNDLKKFGEIVILK